MSALAALTCEFCKNGVDVEELKRCTVCRNCKQVSKKCRKGSGLYYQIANPRAEEGVAGAYVTGDELAGVAKSLGRPAIVFDFHNVADWFRPEEFAELVAPLVGSHSLHVLSYVGSTTPTRVGVDADIKARMALVPELQGWLCFHRSEVVEPGNKGGFIQALGATSVCFFDDSQDHVESGKAAGADSVLVPKNSELAAKRVISKKLRGVLGLPGMGGSRKGETAAAGGKGDWSDNKGRRRGRVQGGWA